MPWRGFEFDETRLRADSTLGFPSDESLALSGAFSSDFMSNGFTLVFYGDSTLISLVTTGDFCSTASTVYKLDARFILILSSSASYFTLTCSLIYSVLSSPPSTITAGFIP